MFFVLCHVGYGADIIVYVVFKGRIPVECRLLSQSSFDSRKAEICQTVLLQLQETH